MKSKALDYDFKQALELYAYYFGNQTLAEKISIDYMDKVIANPKLFGICASMYIDSLKSEIIDLKIKDSIVQLIISNSNIDTYLTKINQEPKTLDKFGAAKRFFWSISKYLESENQTVFKELIHPNDLQLTLCVWGNNIKVDENEVVINEAYATNRAFEFIKYNIGGVIPEIDFEEFELVHNT